MNLGNLFGKKQQPNKAETQEKAMSAITDLTSKITDLEEKINYIETKKNNLNEQAKTKLKAGDKNGARQALAKKKKYDEQIKQFDGAIMMMEEQKMMLESADSMRSIMESLKKASDAVSEAQKGMSVEDLDKLRDKMEDLKDNQKEMAQFFESYATTEDVDVEDELDQLAMEMEGEKAKDDLPETGKSKYIFIKIFSSLLLIHKLYF
jgi:charged multivesicular body protein 4